MNSIAKLLRLTLLIVLSAIPLHAQLLVREHQSLPRDRQNIDLSHYRIGSDVGTVMKAWGIRMTGPGSRVVLRYVREHIYAPPPVMLPPHDVPVFSNEPALESEDSSNRPLVFQFENPIRAFGFSPADGAEGVTMSIRAYDATGKLLGESSMEQPDEELWQGISVTTSAEEGISTLVIDYGDAPQPEQVWLRAFEFIEDPTFEIFIPQVAAGPLPTGERLQTEMTFLGLSDTTWSGTIDFFDSNGEPLALDLVGRRPTSHLEITRFVSEFLFWLRTNSETPVLESGYARIRSDVPLTANASFRILSEDRIVAQAGIAATPSGRRALVSVQFDPGAPGLVGPTTPQAVTNTGLAFVNASDEEVSVHFGIHVPGGIASPSLILPPRGHSSAFATELFEVSDDDNGYTGSVSITASGPIAVGVLQTTDGWVDSSLPAAVFPE